MERGRTMPRTVLLGIALVALALTGKVAGQPQPRSTLPRVPDTRETEAQTVNGRTLAEWKLQLKHEDPSKRTLAIASIVQFGEANHEVVQLLLDRTRDRDMSPRLRAI